ncbi:MAG TPA: PQQ-binding-like beta-propeller repeat protein, partial [Polyangiaceae bacterium]
ALHAGTAFYLRKGVLTAVDAKTSALEWTFTGDGHLCTSPVVAGAGAQVFVGSSSGNVYELDEVSGAQKSVSNAGKVTCGTETNAVSIGLGHLVVPTGNGLVAY